MRVSLFLCVLASSFYCAQAAAESIDKSFHESFDVEPGAVLHLRSGDGDVVIESWDEATIDVSVEYHYERSGLHWGRDLKDFNVLFRQEGDGVFVDEDKGESGTSVQLGTVKRREYVYSIKAPAWVELDIDGEDGDIHVSDWDANVEIVCDDGDVDLVDSNGSHFELQMQDGNLRLRHCAADIHVEIEDGDVDVEEVTTQNFALEASDGEIDLDLVGDGVVDWEVRVDDGDVRLAFSGEIDADVLIETDDGDIRIDTVEIENTRSREGSYSGRLGAGKGRLRLSTEDGDISLRQRNPAS
jgi:hypothetical protein